MSIRYLLRKLFYGITVLVGVVTLVFLLFNMLPADSARLTLGQRSDKKAEERVRRELNLDKPAWIRYLLYLNDLSPVSVMGTTEENTARYHPHKIMPLSSGEALVLKKPYLGRSYQSKKPVWDMIAEALPGTLLLAFTSILLATVAGISLGIFAALKRNTVWDMGTIMSSVVGISAPSFFAGLLIAYIFGFKLQRWTGLDMIGSLWDYDPVSGRQLHLSHLILPAVTLGIRPLAIIVQLTRSALLDVFSMDYIRTAYAKGLSKRQVIWRHALPNALNPVVTSVSGWLAELLAGSFFVEYIFSWKGLGKLTVDALDKFDFPIVMGAVLVTAFIFIVVNLLTDLLYTRLDPRIKLR